MKVKKQGADAFIRAAKVINSGKENFSCIAVTNAAELCSARTEEKILRHYYALFSPFLYHHGTIMWRRIGEAAFWNCGPRDWNKFTDKRYTRAELKRERVDALILASVTFGEW